MQTHCIHQQTVEVEMTGTELQAIALQRRMAELCEHTLPAVMEKVLNLHAHDKNDIIIDYLSITVNGLPSGDFSEAFVASVASQLEAALHSRVLPESSKHPAPAHDGKLIVYKRDAQIVELESRVESVFFHFLRTGVLPWWTSPDQVKSWEAAVLNLLSASPSSVAALRRLLLQHPAARQRFLLQFSRNWQQTVLPLLSPAAFAAAQQVQAIVAAAFAAPVPDAFFAWQLGRVLEPADDLLPVWLQHAVAHLAAAHALPAVPLPQQVRERLTHSRATLPADSDPSALAAVIAAAVQQPPPAQQHITVTDNAAVSDRFYIHNAGLILLVPFIPQYLRQCGAADGTGIMQEGYATALLEYLATGRTGVGEHELIFNKVLCGIPTGRPVARVDALAEAHRREADDLLSSVIANWPVLKQTSIGGLRSSFLQRPGKLTVKDDDGNWLLQVETQSYDEWLLGELPWGYQVTAIPYGARKKLIWTEWI